MKRFNLLYIFVALIVVLLWNMNLQYKKQTVVYEEHFSPPEEESPLEEQSQLEEQSYVSINENIVFNESEQIEEDKEELRQIKYKGELYIINADNELFECNNNEQGKMVGSRKLNKKTGKWKTTLM